MSHLCTGWVWEGQVPSGVSQGNVIQVLKQRSLVPYRRLMLPVWERRKKTHTQKPPFPVVLELEARHYIMLGALGSQVCVHQEVRQFGPLQCEAA